MSYRFSKIFKNQSGDLSVIFCDKAGHEIIMGMESFARFKPMKENHPYIHPREVTRAGVQIIKEGHDYFPPRMTEAEAMAMSYA